MSAFTDEEGHSMMIGFLEILCPFKPRYPMDLHEAEFTTAREYHYYLGGRALGLPVVLFELIGVARLVALIF